MTDAEKLFKETERERKRLGYGDRHKKRQGGRYVRTPSDYLTKKEREAMNGEVKTWKLKEFYTFDEFRELPDDEQIRWVNSLITRYGCSANIISKIVFGKTGSCLNDYLHARDVWQYINKGSKGAAGRSGAAKLKAAFEAWTAEQVKEELPEEEEPAGDLVSREDVRDAVFHEVFKCGTSEQVEEIIDNIPSADAAKPDWSNLAMLISSLAGTGAKLTIEVTL